MVDDGSQPLPCLDLAGDDCENRVGRDLPSSAKLTPPFRITQGKFAFQMPLLVGSKLKSIAPAANLAAVFWEQRHERFAEISEIQNDNEKR
jgi:hypothetical protein